MVETTVLPVHRRSSAPFEDTFGAAASTVLASMDRAGDDLVAERPRVPIRIARVGYTHDDVLVQLRDPFGSGQFAWAICAVRIATSVPPTRRGVHMSRIGDVVAQAAFGAYDDLAAFAQTVARSVSDREYGGPTSVTVRANVPYVEEPSQFSAKKKMSLEHLQLLATVRGSGTEPVFTTELGIQFSHIVACPCVQKTYMHARFAGTLPDLPIDAIEPGFTHSQRCTTTIAARGVTRPLPVRDLLRELDAVVVRTQNTLPRDAELALVFRAHRSPQFIEDALREALYALYRSIDGADTFSLLRGSSRSAESIHQFDLAASASVTREEIRAAAAAYPADWRVDEGRR